MFLRVRFMMGAPFLAWQLTVEQCKLSVNYLVMKKHWLIKTLVSGWLKEIRL